MKLKSNFTTVSIEDTQFMVAVGSEKFNGVVRNNKTAAFIVDCLKKETTIDAISDAMCAKYDAPRDCIVADVKEIIEKLRSIDALDE